MAGFGAAESLTVRRDRQTRPLATREVSDEATAQWVRWQRAQRLAEPTVGQGLPGAGGSRASECGKEVLGGLGVFRWIKELRGLPSYSKSEQLEEWSSC